MTAAGMLQLAVWTALAEKGLGASLQHYNPLIDDGGRRRIRSAVQLGAAGADAVRHRRPGRGSG